MVLAVTRVLNFRVKMTINPKSIHIDFSAAALNSLMHDNCLLAHANSMDPDKTVPFTPNYAQISQWFQIRRLLTCFPCKNGQGPFVQNYFQIWNEDFFFFLLSDTMSTRILHKTKFKGTHPITFQ